MSDNKRPMTRREIREREAAASAGQPYPSGGMRQQPPRPGAPAPGEGRSALNPPVARPPQATGGSRGVDATGRLTPVRQPGEAPPSFGPGGSGHSGPSAPSGPGSHSAPHPFGSRPTPAPAPPASPQSRPRRLGRQGAVPAPGGANDLDQTTQWGAPPAPVQPPSPFGARTNASGSPSRQRPEAPARPTSGPAGLAMPGSGVTSGGSPMPGASTVSGGAPALPWETSSEVAPRSVPPGGAEKTAGPAFPGRASSVRSSAMTDQPRPGAPGQSPRGGRSASSRSSHHGAEDAWIEEDEGPQYTWLHYIILVVVAFVLGLLIWKLVLEGDSAGFEESQASILLGTLSGGLPGLRGSGMA